MSVREVLEVTQKLKQGEISKQEMISRLASFAKPDANRFLIRIHHVDPCRTKDSSVDKREIIRKLLLQKQALLQQQEQKLQEAVQQANQLAPPTEEHIVPPLPPPAGYPPNSEDFSSPISFTRGLDYTELIRSIGKSKSSATKTQNNDWKESTTIRVTKEVRKSFTEQTWAV